MSFKTNISILSILTLGMLVTCTRSHQESNEQEPHRPQFHFTPAANWMNDPNGMVYYQGEYHLFYQYYPDSTVWGPMHWGHAISKDLVHWEHLPIALYPDSLGYIFSGSCVVDHNNSGFQTGEENPLVSIFTYHDKNNLQTQAIAYSNDRGRSWKKYENNPVIKNPGEKDFRDPKVFWYPELESWIMSLAVGNRIQFYRSENLKDWELASEFGANDGSHGGVWECPDLFPLKVEGSEETKWVLLVSINPGSPNGGSGTQYFIGNFDGKIFTNDNDSTLSCWIDYGRDNYAGVTWSNAPDNRTLFLGWMSNWDYAQVVPTETWRSAMTIPRELTLRNTSDGIRLISNPVKELEQLRGTKTTLDFSEAKSHSGLMEVLLSVDLKETTATDFGIELSNSKNESLRIGFNKTTNQYYIDRTKSGKLDFSANFAGIHNAPRIGTDNTLTMQLFIDLASVELFADNGSVCITDIFFPNEDFKILKLYKNEGEVKLLSGETYELKPIW
jgi:fructan beta-fructosidase